MTWATAPHILETTDIAAVYADTHEPIVTLDNGATALVLYVVVREDSAKHPAVADVPQYLALAEMPARLLPVGEAFIADGHPPTLDALVADPTVIAAADAPLPANPAPELAFAEKAEPERDGNPALADAPEFPAPAVDTTDDGERGEPGTGPDPEPESETETEA